MTFDILVFEEDELADGSMGMKQHPENGVHAKSRKELIGLYAMAGQKIKILREYGAQQSGETIQASPANIQSSDVQVAKVQQNQQQAPVAPKVESAKPKFFKVAGIECKLENNKLYQKQWMKVDSNESENYRIVSDSTNKIVSLNGKHIEKLTWVLTQDQDDKDTESEPINANQ